MKRLLSLDKPFRPQPPDKYMRIQGLPNRMILLNPTKTEEEIIKLYSAELRKLCLLIKEIKGHIINDVTTK